jgi:hypothetical protein
MGRPRLKLEGKRFGRLVVVAFAGMSKRWPFHSTFRCKCDCGRKCVVPGGNLKRRKTQSCGCKKIEVLTANGYAARQHGETVNGGSVEYTAWEAIKARCYNKHRKGYADYGGRGIRMCKRWLNTFPAFLADVGRRPSPYHSIDRINNNGNYTPSNVRWATRKEQNTNKRQRSKQL